MRILITGAGRRIGKDVSQFLASQGHQLILHYNRAEHEARQLLEKIGGREKGHSLLQANFSNAQEVESLFNDLQPFDVLINNASTYNMTSLEEVTPQQIREDYQVNFFAPFTLMQMFKKFCKKGQIINFIDQRVHKVEPSAGAYLLAKKNLRDTTEAAAVEWAPDIRVNALALGKTMKPETMTELQWEEEYLKAPQQRPISMEEIHQACQFLLNSEITGQIIYLDSGLHLI